MPTPPCYVFFSTDPTSGLSRTIRDLGNGKESHAGIIYWSADFSQWMVLDATESGWTIRSYAQFKKQGNVLVRVFAFPQHDLFDGVWKNRELIGVPYDWNALVGRGVLKWFYALTGAQIKKNHWNDANRYYCNEIIAAKILPSAGIDLGLGNRIDMDPFQLGDLLDKYPAAMRISPERFDHVDV